VVFGWRALRPPRVVFVIGCVSCNKFSHFRLIAFSPSIKSSFHKLRNLTPRPKARAHHRRKPPAEERGSSRHRDTGRRDRQKATGTSGRGPTRGPTSSGSGTTTAGRAQEAPRLATRTELIEENKRRLKALSRRYPGQLELRAPLLSYYLSYLLILIRSA
jgi:hypothetical protein